MEPGGPALTHRPTTRLLLVAALTAAGVVAANGPWTRAYPPGEVLGLLVGAAVLSTGIPTLLASFARLSGWWSMSASAAAFVGYCLVAALDGSFVTLADGLRDGLARLLSESLPVGTPRDVLVPALAATWCSGAVCGEVVARTRAVAAAAGVLVTAFFLADAVTASAPGQPVGWAVALVALAAALLATAEHRAEGELVAPTGEHTGRRRATFRPFALATVTLGAATVVAAVVVPSLPGWPSAPTAPSRAAPVRLSEPLTPTATTVELRDGPLRRLLSVEVDAPVRAYLPVAELDLYDGSSWAFDQLFQPSGGRVPPLEGGTSRGRTVVQHYVVRAGLGMPWMPVLDRAVQVSGVAIDVAARSGMVLPAQPLLVGDRYIVVSKVPGTVLADAPPSALAGGPAPAPTPEDLAVPPAEDKELAGFAAQLAARTHVPLGEPLALLRAVQADLAAHDRTIPPARGRHHHLTPADTTFADAVHAVVVARRATPEQYATFFALLARHLGVPARLATGFRLLAGTRPLDPGRTYTVTSADAWTWTELAVRNLGWVVADPSPSRTGAAPLPTASAASTATATTLPPARAVPRPAPSGHALAPKVHPPLPAGPSGVLPPLLATLAGLAALGVAGGLGLLGARRRRRRRRRRGDPAEAVTGAFLEALDTLRAAPLGDLRPLTAREVVDAARDRLGPQAADHLDTLARLADTAVYSQRPGRLGEAEAHASWAELDALRQAVRQAVPWPARWRAELTGRLRPPGRRRSAQRPGGPERPGGQSSARRHHRRGRPADERAGSAGAVGNPPGRRRVSSSGERAGSSG